MTSGLTATQQLFHPLNISDAIYKPNELIDPRTNRVALEKIFFFAKTCKNLGCIELAEKVVNLRDNNGRTALFYLCKDLIYLDTPGAADKISLLISLGARTDIIDENGFTPFQFAEAAAIGTPKIKKLRNSFSPYSVRSLEELNGVVLETGTPSLRKAMLNKGDIYQRVLTLYNIFGDCEEFRNRLSLIQKALIT